MRSIYTLALGLIVLTSCGPNLVPFTTNLERETGLNKQQLRQVQFYNSTPIVLYRELTKNTTEVVRGEVKILDGKQVEEIVIAPYTPGVLVSNTENRLGISFEHGSDRFLIFGENRHQRGAYTLLAKNWKNSVGSVDYDGREYHVNRHSAATYLMINMQKLKDLKVKSRTAKGRVIGGI